MRPKETHTEKEEKTTWNKEKVVHLLNSGGDFQASNAWRGKLAGVDVGNLPHSSVHVLQVVCLHYQDGLSWIKVELEGKKPKTDIFVAE